VSEHPSAPSGPLGPLLTPIARRYGFSACWACGPDNPHGLHLDFQREGNKVVCIHTPPRELAGYGTILHGGVTSTLLDEAMVWAIYGAVERLSMTTELNVRFHAPVRCSVPLTLTGWVIATDRRHATARAEISDASGSVRASGEGRLRFLSPEAAMRLAAGE
jgi:uncharacterized protein (TIGR00369 family)